VAASRLPARIVETITRRELVGLGNGAFALVDRKKVDAAWFSYRLQLQTLLQSLRIDLVIDVGANQGQFARTARRSFAGPIVSFEPVSAIFEVLSSAAASDPNWHVRHLGLGDENAELAIHIPEQGDFSSFLAANDYGTEHFGAGTVPSKVELVAVRRLDEVLDELGEIGSAKRIFLKMDTQGYDTRVFQGLGERVRDVVAMQSEVSLIPIYEDMPHWTESIEMYEAAGFGVVGLYPVTRDDGRVIEYDCLLKRSTRPPAVEPHVP
jgi:FkbM family methyltransferase